MQQGRERWGSCPDARGLQTIFLLLPFHEKISLVESGHAAGRGSVEKFSRRPGTPNFVPVSCFSRENNPLLGLVTQQGGEARGSSPDDQGLQTLFPASSFSRENNPGLVLSGSREGRGGEVVPTPRDSKLCSLLLLSHERITLVESGHAVGRGGVGKLSRRPWTPNFVPCFFLFTRE